MSQMYYKYTENQAGDRVTTFFLISSLQWRSWVMDADFKSSSATGLCSCIHKENLQLSEAKDV